MFKWLLVGLFSVAAAAACLLIMVMREKSEAWNGLAGSLFFGACAAVALWRIIELRRLKKHLQTCPTVSVRGGVAISNRSPLLYGPVAGAAGIGLALFLLTDGSLMFKGVALAMGLLGCAGLLLLLLGVGRQTLRFLPEGLERVKSHNRVLVAWDNISELSLLTVHDNTAIGLRFVTLEPALASVTGTAQPRDGGRRRLAREFAVNQAWYGCQLVIFPAQFGLDAAYLLQALERYARDPQARADLSVPADILPSPRK